MHRAQRLLLAIALYCLMINPSQRVQRVLLDQKSTILILPVSAAVLTITAYSLIDPCSQMAERLLLGVGALCMTGYLVHSLR